MRGRLLLVLGAISLGCGNERNVADGGGRNAVDSIVHLTSLDSTSSHDTLIHDTLAKNSSARDTFVAHIAATARDTCLTIPKPPECPDYVKALRIDTIPRP